MGNTAIIRQAGKHTGVYLHWNGGRDSVSAFLKYCELKGYRGFDDSYGLARLCQVVGNWFGGNCSIGIVTDVYAKQAKGLDNGIYDVKGWKIVGRVPADINEQGRHDLLEILVDIDQAQPEKERIGQDFFKASIVRTEDIKVGDTVFVFDPIDGTYSKQTVVGLGEDKWVNGHVVLNVPYVAKYGLDGDPTSNPNNYLFDHEYRVVKGGDPG